MIHFPRDLYVDIPGRGKDKINAAFAYGREPLLVETMENLLKIRIHHVARTDFEGFKGMTDANGVFNPGFITSTGAEIRFFMPVLNVPFRLIFASNPQRKGVLNYSTREPEKAFRFRFDVGSTF